MAEKAQFVFQMLFTQTEHIHKKIYLLEHDGCHPIYATAATCDGFASASFSELVTHYRVSSCTWIS